MSTWSSIWKGGVLEVLSTTILVTYTSMAPVASFSLSWPSGRSRTVPLTMIGHSERMVSASWNVSSSQTSGSNSSWVTPSRSRRSTKIRPPWSRLCQTQPVSVTSSPMLASRSSPQVCVCMLNAM